MEAIGIIETKGYINAIVAADNALKTANVTLLSITKISGGLVDIVITGDVGAVSAAVDGAISNLANQEMLVSHHVIARPSNDIGMIINDIVEVKEEVVEEIVEEVIEVKEVNNKVKSSKKK